MKLVEICKNIALTHFSVDSLLRIVGRDCFFKVLERSFSGIKVIACDSVGNDEVGAYPSASWEEPNDFYKANIK